MNDGSRQELRVRSGLLQIEDCLDADGGIALPAGTTLISLIERNIKYVGDLVAYRYLDHARSAAGCALEVTWTQFGMRLAAIGAHVQRFAGPGDRVAILAPQGIDYVCGFYAAIKAGTVAVPLFAPELPGHAERLDTALRDSEPAVILTTAAAKNAVEGFLNNVPRLRKPTVLVIDQIPDREGELFVPVELTSTPYPTCSTPRARRDPGRCRDHPPRGRHQPGANDPVDRPAQPKHPRRQLVTAVPRHGPIHDRLSGGLWRTLHPDVAHGVCPQATAMDPGVVRGSRTGRVVTAAPNFAYEWAAQRGLPAQGDDVDLSNVVLIIGSEPVSIDAVTTFNKAFAPYGLPRTAFKPSYGIAEATLLVATIDHAAEPTVVYLDPEQLGAGHATRVAPDAPNAVVHVSCGHVARSLWAVIVDPDTGPEAGAELPDGEIGEVWLQGDNVAQGYWGRPEETRMTFGARLQSPLAEGSHADGSAIDDTWLRTGDLGVYLDGELYITGRIADLLTIDGRNHYPQDIEATAAEASPMVRRGYITAFTVPASDGDDRNQRLVIIAERAAGTSRSDPRPALDAIRAAVCNRHGLSVADLSFLPAGAIPRTTSGKLARQACRAQYLSGRLGVH